ncbi:unnamed protein product [Darwinula stevensoni]|uniref:Zinc transporter ZIP1 n=1 Tax=Darwinula stevensoni TaxID=69355 RepID=A0A7R9ABF5_9CRUS|nr:unnamed protein product [Darwinula stevensoni]CAG0899011.1 unnamed protein product [Darwinula stevensoni]
MDLLVIKGIMIGTMFLLALIFGLIPLKLMRRIATRGSPTQGDPAESPLAIFLCMANCFSGGVFLTVCLLDLIPKVNSEEDSLRATGLLPTLYPLGMFIIAFGAILLLILEQIVTRHQREGEEEPLIQGEPSRPQPHHSGLRAVILVLTLSLHSIFEGIAVGIQLKENDALGLFIAVILHKSIIAFSLGLSLAKTRLRFSAMLWAIALFSLMSPLGIGIGMSVVGSESGTALSISSYVLQGLACGSFLYVTFFEVLPEEFRERRHEFLKLSSLLAGFGVVSFLLMLDPDFKQPEDGPGSLTSFASLL